MNRKYEKTNGYWVYTHTTPDGMVYVGMSKQQPNRRWKVSNYRGTALQQYIECFGWESIEHRVLIDNLTKQQAEQWEDRIITALKMNGLCINERRSGGHYRDNPKEYQKDYYESHREEKKAYRKAHRDELLVYNKTYKKQLYSTPEGKIYSRVSNYNRNHTPIETPMEAKTEYLEWGYIPSYIKHDDLQ